LALGLIDREDIPATDLVPLFGTQAETLAHGLTADRAVRVLIVPVLHLVDDRHDLRLIERAEPRVLHSAAQSEEVEAMFWIFIP
jgi:hypothetical protein